MAEALSLPGPSWWPQPGDSPDVPRLRAEARNANPPGQARPARRPLSHGQRSIWPFNPVITPEGRGGKRLQAGWRGKDLEVNGNQGIYLIYSSSRSTIPDFGDGRGLAPRGQARGQRLSLNILAGPESAL